MKKALQWLDENLEEVLLVIALAAMAVIMGIQVIARYIFGASLSWSEELTRYIFIWAGFLSVSYCTKKCISIKIEQFVAMFPKRGKAIFKGVNHTFELIKDYGIDEKYFLDTLDEMSEQAFNDQCTGANPRYPLIQEIKDLYLKCYYGK